MSYCILVGGRLLPYVGGAGHLMASVGVHPVLKRILKAKEDGDSELRVVP